MFKVKVHIQVWALHTPRFAYAKSKRGSTQENISSQEFAT
jgi:hypothetical protein